MQKDLLELLIGLAILGGQAFALFLMVLGGIDLYTHVKERKSK